MEKINNFFRENRSFKFLALLFLVGTLGIGVMTLLEPDNFLTITEPEPTIDCFKELQKEITTFENKTNWKLEDYKIAEVSITTSAKTDCISGTTKGNLLTTLNNVLERKTFQRCEAYLSSRKIDNPSELKELLKTLLNVVGSNNKINFYITQIDKYNYYEKVLPSKVNRFVSDPINYTDKDYDKYKIEVENMPGFENKYKVHSKFINISKNLKGKLDKFNVDFYNSSPLIPIKKIKDKVIDI